MRRRSNQRGFTLLELACVVAIISILIQIAVPNYQAYRYRAMETEALVNIETIAYFQQVAILERGHPLDCPKNPGSIPHPRAPFELRPQWQALGFKPLGLVRHQYEVKTDGLEFSVWARGDLDGDGMRSEHVLESATMTRTSIRLGE